MIGIRLLASLFLASAATVAGAAEVSFVTCDNGLRCFRPPCPAQDVVLLPSGRRLARTGPDLAGLTSAERQRSVESDGLYYGTMVLAGTVEQGPATKVVARSIVRPATRAEADLCRRRR